MAKVLVQMSHMYNIGGIETAMWQLAKAFRSADITFLVNSIADGGKVALERLKTLHNVILDDQLDKVQTVAAISKGIVKWNRNNTNSCSNNLELQDGKWRSSLYRYYADLLDLRVDNLDCQLELEKRRSQARQNILNDKYEQ